MLNAASLCVNCMLVRRAKPEDSESISKLMDQLGYSASNELILRKLEVFASEPSDEVLVAESDGELAGVVSCHITSLFHQDGALGRITSFVVDERHRGSGVGRSLVSAAEDFFKLRGCVRSEVTSGDHRIEAHEFYKSCGFEENERRFIKAYS